MVTVTSFNSKDKTTFNSNNHICNQDFLSNRKDISHRICSLDFLNNNNLDILNNLSCSQDSNLNSQDSHLNSHNSNRVSNNLPLISNRDILNNNKDFNLNNNLNNFSHNNRINFYLIKIWVS